MRVLWKINTGVWTIERFFSHFPSKIQFKIWCQSGNVGRILWDGQFKTNLTLPKKLLQVPQSPTFQLGDFIDVSVASQSFGPKHRFSIMHCQLIAWTLFTTVSLECPSNSLSLRHAVWDSLTPFPSAHWEGRNNKIRILSSPCTESPNKSLEESKDSWFGQNWRKSKVLDLKDVIAWLRRIESETNPLPQ